MIDPSKFYIDQVNHFYYLMLKNNYTNPNKDITFLRSVYKNVINRVYFEINLGILDDDSKIFKRFLELEDEMKIYKRNKETNDK